MTFPWSQSTSWPPTPASSHHWSESGVLPGPPLPLCHLQVSGSASHPHQTGGWRPRHQIPPEAQLCPAAGPIWMCSIWPLPACPLASPAASSLDLPAPTCSHSWPGPECVRWGVGTDIFYNIKEPISILSGRVQRTHSSHQCNIEFTE